MMMSATPTHILQNMFDHIFLLVPDVFPKENVYRVMQKHKGVVTPVVWNVPAQNELRKKGLEPLCVQPQMVQAFASFRMFQLPQSDEWVAVKTSGSGMPFDQMHEILTELREQEHPYEFHHPNFIITRNGIRPTIPHGVRRRAAYMEKLAKQPPWRLISLPSEQARIALEMMMLGWDGRWASLEARGPHEKKNLEEIQKWGVKQVAHGWYGPGRELRNNLGRTPLVQAMLAHLQHV